MASITCERLVSGDAGSEDAKWEAIDGDAVTAAAAAMVRRYGSGAARGRVFLTAASAACGTQRMELDTIPEAEAEARLSAYQEAHGLPHRDDDELSVAAKGADTLAEIEGFIAKKCVPG